MNKGISLITLVISVIIMLILSGITIYTSNIIEKSEFQEIFTNMQLISTKVNIIIEKVAFEGEQSKSKYYVGLRLKDIINKVEIAGESLTSYELENEDYYVYDQPTLDSIGLEGIKLKQNEFYIVNYRSGDIIYPNGCIGFDEEIKYKLSEIYDNGILEDIGGDTGDDTGGDTGDDTGGDTGDDTGGDTGDDTGGDTGDDTGGDTGECEHEFTIEATCITPMKCSKCGIEQGNPLGHTPGTAATCTDDQICTVCTATLAEALGHSYAAATCTKPKTCTRCSATTGSALGHTNGAAATCTTAQKCTVCSTTIKAALGHSYAAATCTKPKTCTRCSATTGSANGHTWGSYRVGQAATCTVMGYRIRNCTVCGTLDPEKVWFAALGHNWHYYGSSGFKCTRCGTVSATTY